jgi:alpha-methylacyl-CoA racemase
MVDGSALLATMFFEMSNRGMWSAERGTNALDGGAPFYDSYETADAKWVAVGAVEPQFWATLVELLGIGGPELPDQMNQATWPALRTAIATAIKQRTRDEWAELAAGTDACLTPVLTLSEVVEHPHNKERQSFIMVGESLQPAPAPRFSRTPPAFPFAPPPVGSDARAILSDWGFEEEAVAQAEQIGAYLHLG